MIHQKNAILIAPNLASYRGVRPASQGAKGTRNGQR